MLIGTSLEAITGRSLDTANPGVALETLLGRVVDTVRELRLQVVEIPLDAFRLYPALFRPVAMTLANRVAQEHGFSYSIHLPYQGLDFSSADESVRRSSVARLLDAARATQRLQPVSYVLHLVAEEAGENAATYALIGARPTLLPGQAEQAERSLREILQELGRERLCVENLRGAPFGPQLPLVERYDVSLCLDVGHLAVQGQDPLAFLRDHLARIREVHLHDVVRRAAREHESLQDHQPLGSGFLPVAELLTLLRDGAYQGVLLLEIFEPRYLAPSVAFLKRVLG